jgi:hypothetical protein
VAALAREILSLNEELVELMHRSAGKLQNTSTPRCCSACRASALSCRPNSSALPAGTSPVSSLLAGSPVSRALPQPHATQAGSPATTTNHDVTTAGY